MWAIRSEEPRFETFALFAFRQIQNATPDFSDGQGRYKQIAIKYSSVLLVLGGGGHKPKDIRAFQEDPKLTKENYLLREISKRLSEAMQDGNLKWNNFFNDFIGNFTFDDTNTDEDF